MCYRFVFAAFLSYLYLEGVARLSGIECMLILSAFRSLLQRDASPSGFSSIQIDAGESDLSP